jgi:hypothetical protein
MSSLFESTYNPDVLLQNFSSVRYSKDILQKRLIELFPPVK